MSNVQLGSSSITLEILKPTLEAYFILKSLLSGYSFLHYLHVYFGVVFFSDSEVDFLPISQEDNRIHISGDSFEIPCRVNNPNTTVTLKLCYREQDNCQSTVLDRYNQSYEPKRGRHP